MSGETTRWKLTPIHTRHALVGRSPPRESADVTVGAPVSWSRKPKPSPKPRELERKVQAWGERAAKSMEHSPEETLQESQDVLKWSLRKNGPDSPFTIKAMNEVANQLSRQNRVTEEITLREQIVDGLRKNVGPDDDATLNAEFKLATCLMALERPGEADPLLTHVVAGRSLALGEDDPQTLSAKAWSASAARRVGRLHEARALQEQVLDGYNSRGEGESDQGLLAALNLASTLTELDELDDARDLVRSVLDVRLRILGPDDPKSLEAQRVLASIEADPGVSAPAPPDPVSLDAKGGVPCRQPPLPLI